MFNSDKERSRKNDKNPSFSSTLLDEIYRSIDGYDQRREDLKLPKEKALKKHSNGGAKAKISSSSKNNKSIEDEEIASYRRACLIDKWMEKKVLRTQLDSDPLYFSSSSWSDSSSGTLSSSSEAECFHSAKSSKPTCFAAPRTKSVRRSSVSPNLGRRENHLYTFDEIHNQQIEKNEESLIKSKSRALKIYSDLKKVKQPISPGGRLTSFLNSLFTNGNAKKSKNLKEISGGYEDGFGSKPVGQDSSTCSSASSFSRSCLSRAPQNLKNNKINNGVKRTVRFNPVGVIVDEDSRPCGHKSIYNVRDSDAAVMLDKNRKFQVSKTDDSLKSSQQHSRKKDDYVMKDYAEEIEEEDDDASDSSSDLFEIDHLAFFGNNRFCEELPVYETTHLHTNRGIASGFIH